jgi:hypothetical protein
VDQVYILHISQSESSSTEVALSNAWLTEKLPLFLKICVLLQITRYVLKTCVKCQEYIKYNYANGIKQDEEAILGLFINHSCKVPSK